MPGVTHLMGYIRVPTGRKDEAAMAREWPKAEMDRGFADLREAIGRRLDPLETAVRHHSIEIERLKQGRS